MTPPFPFLIVDEVVCDENILGLRMKFNRRACTDSLEDTIRWCQNASREDPAKRYVLTIADRDGRMVVWPEDTKAMERQFIEAWDTFLYQYKSKALETRESGMLAFDAWIEQHKPELHAWIHQNDEAVEKQLEEMAKEQGLDEKPV